MTPAQLKQARQSLGLTQDELATALYLSRVMVVMMEGGSKDISRRTELAVECLQRRAGVIRREGSD